MFKGSLIEPAECRIRSEEPLFPVAKFFCLLEYPSVFILVPEVDYWKRFSLGIQFSLSSRRGLSGCCG